MTEADWLVSADGHAMFHHLRWWVLPPGRKHRLFACAVCRRCWSLLSDLARYAVGIAEASLDGAATPDRSAVADELLGEYQRFRIRRGQEEPSAEERATLIAYAVVAIGSEGMKAADDAIRNVPHEEVPVADLLRCVFGNPFQPATFVPEWRTSTVLALAERVYASRDFSGMPILADALQDSGCSDEAVLNHCRGPGPHARGCHVIDACLGKA